MTILGYGLVNSKMYEQALAYIENAISIASGIQDADYPLTPQELRMDVLIGLRQPDQAQGIKFWHDYYMIKQTSQEKIYSNEG